MITSFRRREEGERERGGGVSEMKLLIGHIFSIMLLIRALEVQLLAQHVAN